MEPLAVVGAWVVSVISLTLAWALSSGIRTRLALLLYGERSWDIATATHTRPGGRWRIWKNALVLASWVMAAIFSNVLPSVAAQMAITVYCFSSIAQTALELVAPHTLRWPLLKKVVESESITLDADAIEFLCLLPTIGYCLSTLDTFSLVRTAVTTTCIVFAFCLGPLQAYVIDRLYDHKAGLGWDFKRDEKRPAGVGRVLGQQRVFWVGVTTLVANVMRLACIGWWAVDAASRLFFVATKHLGISHGWSIGVVSIIGLLFLGEVLLHAVRSQVQLWWLVLTKGFVLGLERIGAHNIPQVHYVRSQVNWTRTDACPASMPNLGSPQLLAQIEKTVRRLRARRIANTNLEHSVLNEVEGILKIWRISLYWDTSVQGMAGFVLQLAQLYGYNLFGESHNVWESVYLKKGRPLHEALSSVRRLLLAAAGLDDTDGRNFDRMDPDGSRAMRDWATAGGRLLDSGIDEERARQLLEFTVFTFHDNVGST